MNKEENVSSKQPAALKTFGKVYYPLLAIVAVLLLVFSFVTYYMSTASTNAGFDTAEASTRAEALADMGERNSWFIETGNSSDRAAETIDGWLAEIDGLTEAAAKRANETVDKTDGVDMDITADFAVSGSNVTATYTWQDFSDPEIDYTVDNDTVYAMTTGDESGYEANIFAGRQPNNLVVVIPGSVTRSASSVSEYGDAVLFMTHYDSDSGSAGYAGASSVSAMVSVIDEIISSGANYENDLVFVVTDGRYESSVGAYAFMYQFTGFGNVVERIGTAFNFDAVTSDGTLTIVGTSDADSGIMGAYMASGGTARTDSSVMGLYENDNMSDMNAFYLDYQEEWMFPAINIMVTGGNYTETSPATVAAKNAWLSGDTTSQFAAEMMALAEHFGNVDLASLSSITNAGSFSWMGLSRIATGPAIYVMSAVLVAMIVAALLLAARFKDFSIVNALKAASGVLVVMGFSLAAFAAAYFVFGSLMAAFGVITINMLVAAQMMSPALLAPAVIFAAAVSCGLFPLIKKGFKVKASDCVRGGALLTAVIGAAFGFIYPQASLPFVIAGIAFMAVMMISTLLKGAFRNKYGFGIERLFLYTIPAMFVLPILMHTMLIMGTLVATVSVIFMMLAVTLLLTTITPYFDYVQPVMSDAFEKLPKHTVPVIETVTEEVEDEAKKGKFTTVTEDRLVKHKVAWRYHNWFGVLVITIVATVALVLSCSLGAYANIDFSRNRTTALGSNNFDIRDSIFDNAIVCYIDANTSTTGSYSWLIKDEAVYRNVKYLGNSDFDYWNWIWDDTFGGEYRKYVNTSDANSASNLLTRPDTALEGYSIVHIAPIDGASSQVTINVSGVNDGDTITIYNGHHTSDPSSIDASEIVYSITLNAASDSTEIVLPFGQGDCSMYVETDTSSVSVSGYSYSITDNPTISSAVREYNDLAKGFGSEYGYQLRYAEIIYDTAS